jgi:glycogen operon protein
MVLMGDEVARTQHGNNNAYCHDNELSWFDWSLVQQNQDLYAFTQHCVAFRQAHPVLRGNTFPRHADYVASGYPDISWHGTSLWSPDWSTDSRTLAFLLDGQHAREGSVPDDSIFVIMNMHWESHSFELPPLARGGRWRVFANTGMQPPEDSWKPGTEPVLDEQSWLMAAPHSVIVLVGR